jgi:hypothetical protein
MRHSPGVRNRRKSLKFANDLRDEIEKVDLDLRRIVDVHIRYSLGRIHRLIERLHAENDAQSRD